MRNTHQDPVTIEGSDAFYWGGPFSNFTFVNGGLPYNDRLLGPVVLRTVEHGYQGAKAQEAATRIAIHAVDTPLQALRLGRKCDLPADWPERKVRVMEFLCRRRLAVDSELRTLLLELHAQGLRVKERHPHWGPRTGYIWHKLACELA